VSDEIDRAQAREEEMRAIALEEQARRAALIGDGAPDCMVCGEPIPEPRRQALPGVCTCVECQTDIEQALRRP
jgi:phage/conjugal plasmid C-4 type zinc finger TraR family protein